MKVAVLSDIHSNYYAFKACYGDAVKCGAERFIFLGDFANEEAWESAALELGMKLTEQEILEWYKNE